MAFCTRSMFNSLVTAMTPTGLVADFKHWLGIMSDEEYAKWLNEPDQKKLWTTWGKGEAIEVPGTFNEQEPKCVPLVYNPAYAELPPDMMFMHDAVFDEAEKVEDIDLSIPEYKENWWQEVEGDENIRLRGKDRVQDYLDNSKKIDCLC